MNKYPAWKYSVLLIVFIIALIYALPNVFGEDPSVQISSITPGAQLTHTDQQTIVGSLKQAHMAYQKAELDRGSILVRFNNTDDQQKGSDFLKTHWKDQYLVALTLAPAAPHWLLGLGALPMHLGLDLRGGIHFLLQVDLASVKKNRLSSDLHNISDGLRDQHLRYTGVETTQQGLQVTFANAADAAQGSSFLNNHFPVYQWNKKGLTLTGVLSVPALQKINEYAMKQSIETLQRRVNELGISEATVQQQGLNRISVDLPGVQDATQAQDILGKTATLEFRLVDSQHDAMAAAEGISPPGSSVYMYNGRPTLLKNQVVLTGDQITSATAGFDQNGMAAVNIRMAGSGESNFYRITGEHVGQLLATVYTETKSEPVTVDGKTKIIYKQNSRVINEAVIQTALSSPFQITGIGSTAEANNLALLLRAGALVAPVTIIAEENIGPSMGQQNIHQGMMSVGLGLLLVVLFMMFYYHGFGLIANIGLVLNLIFLVAIMSLLGAVLSFPGIAGIVLTVGMAVDANVLIYERIREELRHGVGVQAAIHAGYARAFATIVDANVTTLIAAVVLFSIGSGAIKGFAITLIIGILTSILSSVTYTRAIVNWVFGSRKLTSLPIGINISKQQKKKR